MKICWDNLEKLEYKGNGKFQKTGTTNYYIIKKCKKCNNEFLGNIYVNSLYCNYSCSQKGTPKSKKHKKKLSEAIIGEKHFNWGKRKQRIVINCLNCNKKIETYKSLQKRKKCCSRDCLNKYLIKIEARSGKNNSNFGNRKYTDLEYKNWQEYKEKARIESYATYRLYKNKINPKNHKIGRYKYHLDHKYSIHDGFHNDVPIGIISHSNNLQILFCKDNLKKNKNSCITLNELKGEI